MELVFTSNWIVYVIKQERVANLQQKHARSHKLKFTTSGLVRIANIYQKNGLSTVKDNSWKEYIITMNIISNSKPGEEFVNRLPCAN